MSRKGQAVAYTVAYLTQKQLLTVSVANVTLLLVCDQAGGVRAYDLANVLSCFRLEASTGSPQVNTSLTLTKSASQSDMKSNSSTQVGVLQVVDLKSQVWTVTEEKLVLQAKELYAPRVDIHQMFWFAWVTILINIYIIY